MGNCARCFNEPALPSLRTCQGCALKNAAQKHLGSGTRWHELAELLAAQGGRCAYTGEAISIGKDASIEHVAPSSRFPHLAKDLRNLRWVSKVVNVMKRDLTMHEFVVICRQVLVNFGYRVERDNE